MSDPTRDQTTAYCMICGGPAPCETHTFHGEVPANKTTVQQAAKLLSNSRLWPLDRMADYLDEIGITHPRPSEVLQAFFAVLCGESADGE